MRGQYQTVWLVLLAMITMAQAQAQTCRDNILASAPDSRYIDNGNGTVTDQETGLIWKQCPEGLSGADCLTGSATTFTWQQALQHAETAVFAGSSLWRLPNKNELVSLNEQRCFDPAINSRFFPSTPPTNFWSSSTDARYADYAWRVDFYNIDIGQYGNKSSDYYVRLVRGGQ